MRNDDKRPVRQTLPEALARSLASAHIALRAAERPAIPKTRTFPQNKGKRVDVVDLPEPGNSEHGSRYVADARLRAILRSPRDFRGARAMHA